MSTQETKLKDIADAIRVKEGSSDPIIANDFPARIAAIQTGTDTSDATATAGDILSGETAYVASGKVTGTIPTKTESNISVSGPTIIVPSGYYRSQVSKSVATATQAIPTISVNSSGLITASSTQSAGYVTAGTKNATRQLTTQAGKTITPGRTQQTAVSSGRYTTGNIYVAGDSDLTAANIKSGVNIFGVTGTYAGNVSVSNQNITEGTTYHYFSKRGLDFKPKIVALFCIKKDNKVYPDTDHQFIHVLYYNENADANVHLLYTDWDSNLTYSSDSSFSHGLYLYEDGVSINATGLLGTGTFMGDNILILLG